ncbi:unnamed protein product, partial [Amoebophrya sp. A120]
LKLAVIVILLLIYQSISPASRFLMPTMTEQGKMQDILGKVLSSLSLGALRDRRAEQPASGSTELGFLPRAPDGGQASSSGAGATSGVNNTSAQEQSSKFCYAELEIVNAYQHRRQFRLAFAGIAYNGKEGEELRSRTGLTPEDVVLHEDWVCFRSRSPMLLLQIFEAVMKMCGRTGFRIRLKTQKMCVTEDKVEHFFKGTTAAEIRSEMVGEQEEEERRATRGAENLSRQEMEKMCEGTP